MVASGEGGYASELPKLFAEILGLQKLDDFVKKEGILPSKKSFASNDYDGWKQFYDTEMEREWTQYANDLGWNKQYAAKKKAEPSTWFGLVKSKWVEVWNRWVEKETKELKEIADSVKAQIGGGTQTEGLLETVLSRFHELETYKKIRPKMLDAVGL
jgi:hypothetical protein